MIFRKNGKNPYQRLFAFFQRHWLLGHLVLLPFTVLSIAVFYRIPALFADWTPGPKTALAEWLVSFTLIFARFLELEIPSSFPAAFCVTAFLFFFVPQFFFWAYRRGKHRILFLVALTIALDVTAIYGHSAYCVWSYQRAVECRGETMERGALFERCGYPFCSQRLADGQLVTYYYSDGYMYASVDFDNKENVYIHRIPLLLGDSFED